MDMNSTICIKCFQRYCLAWFEESQVDEVEQRLNAAWEVLSCPSRLSSTSQEQRNIVSSDVLDASCIKLTVRLCADFRVSLQGDRQQSWEGWHYLWHHRRHRGTGQVMINTNMNGNDSGVFMFMAPSQLLRLNNNDYNDNDNDILA